MFNNLFCFLLIYAVFAIALIELYTQLISYNFPAKYRKIRDIYEYSAFLSFLSAVVIFIIATYNYLT